MKKKVPKYLKEILKKNPEVFSGRKNYEEHHKRVLLSLRALNKFKKINSNLFK